MSGQRAAVLLWTVVSLPVACSFDTGGVAPAKDGGRGEIGPDLRWRDLSGEGSVPSDQGSRDLLPDQEPTPWWDGAWSRRRKLTFDNTARDQALSVFPVLVVLNDSRIDYAAAASAGEDLRFVDEDQTTLLPHQIEKWAPGAASYLWVRVPQIDALSGTDHIWLYYGNPAAADGQDPGGVWDVGFAGVWHLGSDALDSSPNHNHAGNHGPTATDGPIGEARWFDGVDDYLELPNSLSLALDSFTVELWFQSSQAWDQPYWPASATLITRATEGCNSNDWAVLGGRAEAESGNVGRVLAGVGLPPGACDARFTSGPQKNDGAPHYLVWTRSAAGDNLVYLDAVEEVALADSGGSVAGDRAIHVGGEGLHPGGSFLLGIIDEVRISEGPRDHGWIQAQHASMTDALVSYGPEELR